MKCSCGIEFNNDTTIIATEFIDHIDAEFDNPKGVDESVIVVDVECMQCEKRYFGIVKANSLIAEE